MSKDKISLLEQAQATMDALKKRGVQQARAKLKRSRESKLEWRDGKLDRLRESTRMALSVDLFVDGRYSANTTSDLRPEAIASFLDETIATTKVLAKDEHRQLPDPKRYADRFSGDLKLYDAGGVEAMTPDARKRIVQELEAGARSAAKPEEIVSVSSRCSDSLNETAMVTSNGMSGIERSSTFVYVVITTAKDEGERKPAGWWWAATRDRGALPEVAQVGKRATERALAERGAKPEKSGQYDCIIENAVVSRLLNGVLRPLKGNAIQQKRSFLADKVGTQIAAKRFTIMDDPHLVGGLASTSFDGEGMSTIKRPVIEKGVLRGFFLDTYYASKLKKEPTTAGPSNLVFSTGKSDLNKLLKNMKNGILVTGFSGGNSNAATGDFSIGIRGQWVEKGKIVRPVAEMNLAGNHLSFWKRVAELGNDPFQHSSMRAPSLRFDKVQFSGV